MTAPPTPRRARATRDLRRLAVAVVLLGASGLAWLWFSADAQQKRDKVLATIPAFPARGQEERPRGTLRPQSAAPGRTSPQPPAARAAPPARPDVMTPF